MRQRQRFAPTKSASISPLCEALEARLLMIGGSVSLLGQITLPGAESTWNYSEGPFYPSAIMADLDGNGKQDILVPGGDGNLYAYSYNASSSTDMVLDHTYSQLNSSTTPFQSTPAVTTLQNGTIAIFAANADGQVYGWNAQTGAILPGWPATVVVTAAINPLNATLSSKVIGAVVAADLEGTGQPDILVTSLNHELTVFHADGTLFWRYSNDDTILGAPVVGDLNRDGHMEVVFGGDSSAGAFYNNGGRITCLSANGQREWITQIPQVAQSSPALADLTGSGYLDVVIGTGYNFNGVIENRVYALDQNGNMLPGWPYVTNANDSVVAGTYPSPVVADLTGTGHLDVIIGDGTGTITAINPNGTMLWSVEAFAGQHLFSSAIVADVNGDGQLDVIVESGTAVRAFSGNNGAQIDGPGGPTAPWYADPDGTELDMSSVAVGHFMGDSSWQLVVLGAGRNTSTGAMLSPSKVSLFNLPATAVSPAWPMQRRDASGDAVYRDPTWTTTFVNTLYQDMLNRLPTAPESAQWVTEVEHDPTLRTFINYITTCPEAIQNKITAWYELYLGRAPDSGGLAYWTAQMNAGQTDAWAVTFFAASDEAFNLSGGTNADWVTYMYQKMLGRTPTQVEAAGWISGLNANTLTRSQVTYGFAYSLEYTYDRVEAWYAKFQPGGESTPASDSLEAAAWDLRSATPGGMLESTVLQQIIDAGGDYVKYSAIGNYIRAVYQDMLGRAITVPEMVSWLQQFENNGETLAGFAAAVVQSYEYRANLVASWYEEFLGHAPQGNEDAYWVDQITAGATRQSVILGFIESQEFMNLAGNTLTGFIQRVYQTVLGRPATQTDINIWETRPAGENVYLTCAENALGSPEYIQNIVLGKLYMTYLRRLPTTGPDYSVIDPAVPYPAQAQENFLLAGGNPEVIEEQLLATQEYYTITQDKAFWAGTRWIGY